MHTFGHVKKEFLSRFLCILARHLLATQNPDAVVSRIHLMPRLQAQLEECVISPFRVPISISTVPRRARGFFLVFILVAHRTWPQREMHHPRNSRDTANTVSRDRADDRAWGKYSRDARQGPSPLARICAHERQAGVVGSFQGGVTGGRACIGPRGVNTYCNAYKGATA